MKKSITIYMIILALVALVSCGQLEKNDISPNQLFQDKGSNVTTIKEEISRNDITSSELNDNKSDDGKSDVLLDDEKSNPLRGTFIPIGCYDNMTSDGEFLFFVQNKNIVVETERIYRLPLDGGNPECIYENSCINGKLFYYDGYIYFQQEDSILKVSSDGEEIYTLIDDTKIGTKIARLWEVSNKYVYFSCLAPDNYYENNGSNHTDDICLYKTDHDGTNIEIIECEIDKEFFKNYFFSSMLGKTPIFLDGWIYTNGYRIRTDGTNLEYLGADGGAHSIVTDGINIYLGGFRDCDGPLERIKIGEQEISTLVKSGVDSYYMWYLDGYINNINIETGEKGNIIPVDSGKYSIGSFEEAREVFGFTEVSYHNKSDYSFSKGFCYYDSCLKNKWIIKDMNNNVTYSIDRNGNISIV